MACTRFMISHRDLKRFATGDFPLGNLPMFQEFASVSAYSFDHPVYVKIFTNSIIKNFLPFQLT